MGWHRIIRRRVIVNLKTDKAFEGILWRSTRRTLELRDASLLEKGRAPQPVDGEVVLELGNVDFVQVIATPATTLATA